MMKTGETPVTIPNTEVKSCLANGTAVMWESRLSLGFFIYNNTKLTVSLVLL